ncbi:hypothetical protein BC828DRAFT_413608 [Blastocladiella britannica]|nr:hypothetical protein BC828DRAFT_413608 [Blastocladiella britannica]
MDTTIQKYAVALVLGASLILGSQNVTRNVEQWSRARSHNLSRGRSLLMQVIAAVFQLVNQIMFVVQLTMPIGSVDRCTAVSAFADVMYFGFQAMATLVLIRKSTVLVPHRYRTWVRAGMVGFLLMAWITALMSCVKKVVSLDQDEFCIAIYDAWYNRFGKQMLFCLYCFMLVAFMVPALKQFWAHNRAYRNSGSLPVDSTTGGGGRHISSNGAAGEDSQGGVVGLPSPTAAATTGFVSRRNTRAVSSRHHPPIPPNLQNLHYLHHHQHGGIYQTLHTLILSMAFRILLAIFGYLLASVLSFLGVWSGPLWMVQFTIENYCCITASTFAVLSSDATPRRRHWPRGITRKSPSAKPTSSPASSWRLRGKIAPPPARTNAVNFVGGSELDIAGTSAFAGATAPVTAGVPREPSRGSMGSPRLSADLQEDVGVMDQVDSEEIVTTQRDEEVNLQGSASADGSASGGASTSTDGPQLQQVQRQPRRNTILLTPVGPIYIHHPSREPSTTSRSLVDIETGEDEEDDDGSSSYEPTIQEETFGEMSALSGELSLSLGDIRSNMPAQ